MQEINAGKCGYFLVAYNFLKGQKLDISFLAQQYVVSSQCLTYFSLYSDFYLFPAGNKKVGIIIPSTTTTQYLPTYLPIFQTQQQQKCAFLLTTILVLQFFEHIMVKSKQTEIPQFFFVSHLHISTWRFSMWGGILGFKGKPKADQFYYIQLLTELNLQVTRRYPPLAFT